MSLDTNNPGTILSKYIALEGEISSREQNSPAPKFGRAVASVKQLKTLHAAFENVNHSQGDEVDVMDEDVPKLLIDLALHKSTKIAAEHEEFIAISNRKALQRNRMKILERQLLIHEKDLEECAEKINELQRLYQRQETFLLKIFGASYGSDKEKLLEQETDTMHNFRDTLAIGVLQWEAGEKDLTQASNLVKRGIISWKSVMKQSIERKLTLAEEVRNCMQEAAFLVHRVQDTLPGVQFPYCSEREIRIFLQAIEYIFTDMLIDERYQHTTELYENFQNRIDHLRSWMVKTLNVSLRKDLADLDLKLANITKKLRSERVKGICAKLKIPNNCEKVDSKGKMARNSSLYQQPMLPESRYKREHRYGDVLTPNTGKPVVNLGPSLEEDAEETHQIFSDPNLQRDFERKLKARRSAMWPSRRIEELGHLTLSNAM